MAHQRTRIGTVNSDDSQELKADADPLGSFQSANFADDLQGYEPENMFDKNLVLGVLFEKGELPKDLNSPQKGNGVSRNINQDHFVSVETVVDQSRTHQLSVSNFC